MLVGREDASLQARWWKGYLLAALILFTLYKTFLAKSDAPHFDNVGIATEHPQCTALSKRVMLEEKGSAVDAAIAALLCIGIVNNQSSGIGGGGFMLIRSHKESEFLDFRESAPMRTSDRDEVAVPGEVAGMYEAHQRYGKLEWRRIFELAAELAERGFAVSKQLADLIHSYRHDIRERSAMAALYMPGGRPLKQGDTLKRPVLARTLREIGENGHRAFYEGRIAKSIVKTAGRSLSESDLRNYRVVKRQVLRGSFGAYTVLTGDAPSAGPALLLALKLLERTSSTHTLVEVLKWSFAARMQLGDPLFVSGMHQKIREMLDEKSILIDTSHTHSPSHYTSHYEDVRDQGTTHVSIQDERNQLSVSATSTINTPFGSMLLDPDTDILLNNEMDDFSRGKDPNFFGLPPSRSNRIAPGKRPQSSAAPFILLDDQDRVLMVAGATGGSRILSTLIQILHGYNKEKDLHRLVQAPRLHHQLIPNEVLLEDGYPRSLQLELEAAGHKVSRIDKHSYLAAAQIVVVKRSSPARILAIPDPRKGGTGDGF